MDKLTHIKSLLDTIRLSEGSKFECDENSILEEYSLIKENKSNLIIKILSIFGGFLATLAFIGFILIAGLYNSEYGLLIVGLAFIIAAIWLNKIYHKLVIDTLSVSVYIIGIALLAFGLLEMNIDENLIAILITFIAIGSLCIMQNFILSFISILAISGSFLFLIVSNELYLLIYLYITIYTLAVMYIFLNEVKILSSSSKKISRLYNPIRIGSVISLLLGLILSSKKFWTPISQDYSWLASIVMILVTLYTISIILQIYDIKSIRNKTYIYALSIFILISTIFSPSITGAIIIILLSFLVNYKTGIIIGLISIIYFISQYYYDLNFTLLTKSIILLISGVLFLLFYLFSIKNK